MRSSTHLLSEREYEVLSLAAVGMSDDDIAQRSGISPEVVKTHLHIIFKKINASNRLQAMLWAGQNL
jgi:LuxR family transcriptional regulator of csgAB operon